MSSKLTNTIPRMVNVITFEKAIADSEQYGKRHLILGNGFSIACRADIFHYASLFDEADFSNFPEAKDVFNALNTKDFEFAINSLETSALVTPLYVEESKQESEAMADHALALKDLLVATIAGNHPETPNSIDEQQLWACRKFLAYFIGKESGKGGYVFTLNYDLLLYWTLMNQGDLFDDENEELNRNDGFGSDEDEPDADFVVWQGETAAHSANILFLHGALHLFDSGAELQKYTWARSGIPLVDQARAAISDDKFPLFVAEGSSKQKKNKIRHNAYLYQCFKVLTKNAQTGNHCFFLFGHSLAENDDHILKRLAKGKFRKLYVSIFGDPNSEDNLRIINSANKLSELRQSRYPLEIVFYDAQSANVWG